MFYPYLGFTVRVKELGIEFEGLAGLRAEFGSVYSAAETVS